MIERLEAMQRAVRLCNDVNEFDTLLVEYKAMLQSFTDAIGMDMALAQAQDTVALFDHVALAMQARLMVLKSDSKQRLNIYHSDN